MCKLGLFTKDQLAGRYNLSIDTIDFYVRKSLLTPINIDGVTYFAASAFLKIEIITEGKKFGFSLDEIKLLIDSAKSKNSTPSD